MRIVIAGILGAIVIFAWGMVSHMVLPIGEAGMKTPTQQEAVLEAIAGSTSGEGIYMYPSLAPEQWGDDAAMEAFGAQTAGKPYAFVVFQPGGNPATAAMGPSLVKHFASELLGALVVAWVLALAPWAFRRRVLVAAALGAFSWLSISVPYWNWYMFPANFTIANLADQVIGWTLAGAAIAWWLGRGGRAAS